MASPLIPITTVADILTCSLSPVHPHERYKFMSEQFDVAKAWRLIDSWSPSTRQERLVGLRIPTGLLAIHRIDSTNVASANLAIPVIVAEICTSDGEGNFLPIDGYHRMQHALDMGMTTIPAFLLKFEETLQVWIWGVCRDVYLKADRQWKRQLREKER